MFISALSIEESEKNKGLGGGRTELFEGLRLGVFCPKRLEIGVPSKQKRAGVYGVN